MGVVVERQHRVGETAQNLDVEPVVWRAVDLDGGDVIGDGGGDIGAHSEGTLPHRDRDPA